MPLTVPLATLRRDLQELLTDDLAGALKTLRDLLPERSDKHATVVGLLGRLSDANKARLRNTLSNEALQREYDTLRANLLDLLAELTETDFDATAPQPNPSGKPAARQGSVLYRIPHTMPMRRETKCVVRIALDEDAIVEDIQLDEHVTLKALRRVSDLMQVELADPSADGVFRIRGTSETQQLVLEDGYTEWFFYVQPLREGTWPLEVKVAVIELALGKECKREFVLSETIQIVTETPATTEEIPLKSAGYTLPFQPAPGANFTKAAETYPSDLGNPAVEWSPATPPAPEPPKYNVPPTLEPPIPDSRSSNKGLRALAVFLAFLVVGSTATYAFTPADTLDWWQTRYLENTPEAYADFTKDHPQSKYRDLAYYRKALLTNLPNDYRTYLDSVGVQGRYYQQVKQQMQGLEIKYFDLLRTDPSVINVRHYLSNFSTSERLSAVKQIVENRAELRAEAMPLLENAYVESVRQNPSITTVRQYLTDFPQSQRLAEVQQAVDAHPDVKQQVQLYIEDAYIKKVQQNPTAEQVRDYLQNVEVPTRLPELNKLLEGIPKLKKQVQPEMNKAEERRERLLPGFLEEKGKEVGMLGNDPSTTLDQNKSTVSPASLTANSQTTTDQTTASLPESKTAEQPAVTLSQAIKPEMIFVKGGTFVMGCKDGRDQYCLDHDKPAHQVTLSDFLIGKTEVTFAEYDAFCAATRFEKPKDEGWGRSQRPVINVNWYDAVAYCNWLSRQQGLSSVYTIVGEKVTVQPSAKGYRLPTEAEWEYVARGGHRSEGYTYSGDDNLGVVAWYGSNSGDKTHPVSTKKANELGLYDMNGNVYEWCADRWHDSYTGAPINGGPWNSGGSFSRVCRGGSWSFNDIDGLRVCGRTSVISGKRTINLGFRLAQNR